MTPSLFADITSVPYVLIEEVGAYTLDFAEDLTPVEVRHVVWRATKSPEFEGLLRQAETALANNRTFKRSVAPQLIAGADTIIASATASATEKDIARGIKALANQSVDLSSQSQGVIQLLLDMIEPNT